MSGPGRPSTYTDEVAEAICGRLAAGESLNGICQDDDMPPESTVRSWALDDREGFFAKYTRARTIQAHKMFDETLAIADDGRNDTYETDSGEHTNHEVIQRSRLRVDTRKWYLSKVLPKVYGEKVRHEHGGPSGGPVEIAVTRKVVKAPANRIAEHMNGANGDGRA